MYQKDDIVICKSAGVWRIHTVCQEGVELVRPVNGTWKKIRTDNGEIVRRIISKEEMMDIIDRVAFIRTVQAPNDKIRREFYEQAMAEYDEAQWIKIIKTVYLRQEERPVPQWETEFYERAKSYLYEEIAILLGIGFHEVEEYICSAVSNDVW